MIAQRLPKTWQPWYLAARPRSLPATYAPLCIGAALTLLFGQFNLLRFILALIAALLLQIASNYINEYVDFTRGTDKHKSDGMGMVLTRGQLSAQQVLIGAIVSVTAGSLIGLLLVAMSGLTLLWIGMFGVAVVILYTAGPYPLAYIGLGEIAVFFAMGPLMTYGTYYAVSGGGESVFAAVAGLPVGFTVAAILHANNMRDHVSDAAAGKRTLAVRFGVQGARLEYQILIYGAYVLIIPTLLGFSYGWPTLIALLTLPEAIRLVRQAISTDDPKVLHMVQGLTARLHLRFGLALAVGWCIAALILRLAR